MSEAVSTARNVLGEPLRGCCDAPVTGFYRDGFCHTGATDTGRHVICAVMTDDFLAFSAARGNDLATPRPEFDFPGLRACLCFVRARAKSCFAASRGAASVA